MTATDSAMPQSASATGPKVFFPTSAESIKDNIIHHLMSFQGRDPERSGATDIYKALAYTLRDIMVEKWIQTQKTFYAKKKKRVYYLSLEFLIGRSLENSLINLGIFDEVTKAIGDLGYDMDEIREHEEDAALGNGGLGRLAACFMDSIATLKIPAYGYGIHYEYGLFFQQLIDGYQVETPDNWLRYGTPWEFERRMPVFSVHFYGRVSSYLDENGCYRAKWIDTKDVMAIPCDMMIPGFRNNHVINMRLWTARASRELDLGFFSRGDYIGAVESKVSSETISKVLYPPDHNLAGQELRLKQQYFFVAATFQDIMRRYLKNNSTFDNFSDAVAVQLNDTHPSIAIPELMRLLLDIEGLGWEKAWDICTKTFAYTNHTLMPEALEKWTVELLGKVLPRHLEIIYEINQRFLDMVALQYPGDTNKMRKMSIIEEGPIKKVRMANLAIVGSHSVNGVAELHTRLLKDRLFPHFNAFYPGKFNSKTNGITPRRWLLMANRGLADLITRSIGPGWITDLSQLQGIEEFADDSGFRVSWRDVKKSNKARLAQYIEHHCRIRVNPETMFDVQVKRIHEYKRQLLNALHVIHLYHRLIREPERNLAPRTMIFAGKAAPSYWKAKLIIKLITSIGDVVNNDPRIAGRLQVTFLPNYNVSQAEMIMPAADLSEQISTAGTEASGTGNMKFALNGALTIGTLDGANIEILEEVGRENIFIFGMTTEEAEYERLNVSRTPWEICQANPDIMQIIDAIRNGAFSRGNTGLFQPLVDSLLDPHDPYLLMADLQSYIACQQKVNDVFLDEEAWTRMAIMNVARMGKFSTDRTIREYAKEIWGVPVE
ncbi:MAG: glycogen/starch/alpha-glucan phosphorylase [Desulfocapsaceae bacterium]|nr:glycogen/starch/alpha-glucan phosphorylase [Desulfocapsaceae bacterium]